MSDERWLRQLAARAAPLWERPRPAVDATDADVVRARARFRKWRDVLGSTKVLNRRLRGSPLSRNILTNHLGSRHADCEPAAWTETLASVLALQATPPRSAGEVADTADRAFDAAEPLPFQKILIAFVHHARGRLANTAGRPLAAFTNAAQAALERQLLAHLTSVASLTIGRDFYHFRFDQAPVSALQSAWRERRPSTQIYQAYVEAMLAGRFAALLDAYPVLARLLSQAVDLWVGATVEFCQRFVDDFVELQRFFEWPLTTSEQAVAHVRVDLSDRHNGGRTVIECRLQTGDRVIYKPRSVGAELAFARFVEWVNRGTLPVHVKAARALDRTTYGWVECIPNAPCRSAAEVERFYRRAGILLCALHVLATTDIHCENVIASGEHPVIVDLETLLSEYVQHADLRRTDEDAADGASVLRTGLLPRWQSGNGGQRYDMSGLGADASQDPGIRLPVWHAVNTDQMTLDVTAIPPVDMAHRVMLDGAWPIVADYLSKLLQGFDAAYEDLLARRHELLRDETVMRCFDGLDLRVLVRDSATYAQLHVHLLHPEFLRDGIDRSIELEWLARPMGGAERPPSGRVRVYDAERRAMEQLDIPHFTLDEWRTMGHTIADPDLFLLGGERDSHLLRRRLARLGRDDHRVQRSIIVSAIDARYPGGSGAHGSIS